MKRLILTLSAALCLTFAGSTSAQSLLPDTLLFVFKLHGQTRKYQISFRTEHDSLRLHWGIERNLKWQAGSYLVNPEAIDRGMRLSFLQPEDGRHVKLPPEETAYFLSRAAYRQLKEQHTFVYNQTTYSSAEEDGQALGRPLIRVKDEAEGAEMWILDCPQLPLVWRMKNNPLEINWEVNP